jgi:hypothetical protein
MTGHLVRRRCTRTTPPARSRASRHGRRRSLIATSINCIVAQRLARKLCVHCREAYVPTQAEKIADGLNGVLQEGEALYRPGARYQGGYFNEEKTGDDWYGAVRALDPVTGEVKWEHRLFHPPWAGVMSTAGGASASAAPVSPRSKRSTGSLATA